VALFSVGQRVAVDVTGLLPPASAAMDASQMSGTVRAVDETARRVTVELDSALAGEREKVVPLDRVTPLP
jgi:hypothetical protein